jgi:peptidyl-prolyl cis-trans isomerase D
LFAADPQYAAVRKPDGKVNAEMLAAQGMSSEQFAERLRQDYSMRQVLLGLTSSSLAGQTAQNQAVDALLERREVQVQRFDTQDYLTKVNPSDAEVKAYYEAHKAQFHSPESATIEYVVLDLDALKKQVSVSEDDLHKYYTENISRYSVAEERRASHILINAAKDAPAADRAKAKSKAEALLAEVRKAPASFADVAKKNSQDPGSADKGGDLDFFAKGAMVKPFEDATYAMKVGEISNVVESDFGYHIIKLTAVRGGDKKPFDAVRAQIVDEVTKPLVQKRYVEAAEQFANTVYEQSDSLQPVIDKLKLSKATATVMRNAQPGVQGVLASPKLLQAVFSNESLKNKHNTEAVETAPNQMASARVTNYQPERVLPLEAVQAQVLAKVKAEQAKAAARKDGLAKVEAARKDPALAVAGSITVSRTQAQNLQRPVVETILRADLSKGASVSGVELDDQGYAVVKVVKVVAREAADPDTARAKPYVDKALAEAESAAYYDSLKKRFKVEIKAAALSATPDAAEAASGASK